MVAAVLVQYAKTTGNQRSDDCILPHRSALTNSFSNEIENDQEKKRCGKKSNLTPNREVIKKGIGPDA